MQLQADPSHAGLYLVEPEPGALSEGQPVSWLCGTRLVSGSIQSIGFAGSEDQWGRVQVTCMDVLGVANRTYLHDLASDAATANAYLYWPLNDVAGSAVAAELNGGPALAPDILFPAIPTFGVTATAPTSDTQLQLTQPNVFVSYLDSNASSVATFPTINYPAGSLGYWGFWVTPVSPLIHLELDVSIAIGWQFQFTLDNGFISLVGSSGPGVGMSAPWTTESGVPCYVAFGVTSTGTTFTATMYIDGVNSGSMSWTHAALTNAQSQPGDVRFEVGDGTTITVANVAHLAHTPALVHEEAAGTTTEAARLQLIGQVVPDLTFGTIDPALSTAPIGVQQTSGNTALAALLDVMRTEQGQIYSTTSGTLLAPVQTVNVRARTRPVTPAATFDAQADVSGVPQFLRDITNMYSSVTANGPGQSVTVTDPTLIPRAGSATDSETVLNTDATDLQGWAQDRLLRGENVNLRVASVSIDALTAAPATTTALFGLTLGDRVRIDNLPSTSLGFTSWDGWFLGASEVHTPGSSAADMFTLYLAPVLPTTAVFDTDEFASGGNNTLNSAATATATTITVASADLATYLEQTALGYTLLVDGEQMTVTGCTAPSAGVQTATVTRGAGGTTAAAHSASAPVEVVPTALFAF